MNIFLSCFGLRLVVDSWEPWPFHSEASQFCSSVFTTAAFDFFKKKTDQFILNSYKYCKNKFPDITIFKIIVQIYDFLNPDFFKIQNNDLFQS